MNEVYEIYDNEKEQVTTGLRSNKRVVLAEIKELNRRHAINTVNAILMMKAPKRAEPKGNKNKVQKMAIGIADGRYSLITRTVR